MSNRIYVALGQVEENPVALDRKLAFEVEAERREKYGPRYSYLFKCSYEGCTETIRVRGDSLKSASGMCIVHSHVKRPFESVYQRLHTDRRRIQVDLTYEQFLEFTKTKACVYCGDFIAWVPFATVKGKFLSFAYYLDRKDHADSYSEKNCVVCCTACNRMRSNKFTYEEFLKIGAVLREIRELREHGS